MGQTFAPPSRPIAKIIAERLEPLFLALRQFTHGHEIEEIADKYNADREPLRRSLLAFESELVRLRKAIAEKHISAATVRPDLLEWVGYDRGVFYVQLRLLYVRHKFWKEAERVEKLSKLGGTYTREVKDEHGNFAGTETVTDTKGKAIHSNAIEIEL